MTSAGYLLFETAVGTCGLAWNADGAIRAVQLPEHTEASTRMRLQRRSSDAVESMAPPESIRTAITRIRGLLSGVRDDLRDLPLDLNGVPPFYQAVYAIARRIPVGQTLTYGELATQLDEPGAARAVGQALGRNPIPIVIPCHRILAATGNGGFSAHGGVNTKRRLLAIEGARLDGGQLRLL
ncbi:MAG TPA: methylated-DNA--[protein]-cysteine S-methyltransferase [Solimonas sp.]